MADFALSRRVILCFQLCGLHSINLSHMKDSKEVDGAMIKYRLYQLLHIIVVGANCIVVIFCPNSIMFANDPLGRFNDWIKYYAALFTSCLILTESYFRVRQLIEIFRLSGRLDGIFGSIRVDLSQESVTSYRVYIRKFLPFAAMLLLLEIWALPFFLTNTPMFNYWILTFPMLLQSRFRQLQHILYIDLCHHYARVLASNVKELAVFSECPRGHIRRLIGGISKEVCQLPLQGATESSSRCLGNLQLYQYLLRVVPGGELCFPLPSTSRRLLLALLPVLQSILRRRNVHFFLFSMYFGKSFLFSNRGKQLLIRPFSQNQSAIYSTAPQF
uniref:Uncharacterized protein n=1 Tax=Lutzomyia longipalpis TaxID=7200 RepID=A0A240SXQ1_LUTLO